MQGKTRAAATLTVARTRFSFCGWKVDSADIHDYIAEGKLAESRLQGLYILLRDRFPQTAYMFPPHLVRTSSVSRTLAQPRLKRKAVPKPLPNTALFPCRTTKSRHWVLYAVIKCDASAREECLLLFKRPNVPTAALDWSTKYMEKTFQDKSKNVISPTQVSRTWLSYLFLLRLLPELSFLTCSAMPSAHWAKLIHSFSSSRRKTFAATLQMCTCCVNVIRTFLFFCKNG